MTDNRIRWICGMEPMREGEYPTLFEVGKNGVTAIERREDMFGDHAIGWFVVRHGDHVAHEMQVRAVAEVKYFES